MQILSSIEKEEFLPLSLLFLHSFLSGISLVFFETTANTLFLMKYDTTELPLVYILTAFVSIGLGIIYSRFEENLNTQKLLKINIVFILSTIILFFSAITLYNYDLSYMAIMVFKDILWIFAGIEFGILAGVIFNIRQNKRLFGFLISGEIIAGIIGGFSIPFLINHMGTLNLLIISIFFMFISYLLLLHIIKRFTRNFTDTSLGRIEQEEEQKISYKTIFKEKYFLLFFSVSIIAFFVFYFIDYIFYFKVEEQFTDEKQLASFFGVFIALLNIINLFSSMFLSAKVLNRYGIFIALSLIPFIAILGTSSYLLLGAISISIAFFILVVLKLLNEVLDISILSPTYKILYQSISANKRGKVITFKETIIEPFAMGIAGVLLLIFSQTQEIWMICVGIIVLSIIWIILSIYLKENYLLALKKLLSRRQLFGSTGNFQNIDINFLLKNLESENDLDVIYALEFLQRIEYKELDDTLKNSLNHKSLLVKRKVIETINHLELKSLSNTIKIQLEIEKDEQILNMLIQTYTKLEKTNAIDTIQPFLKSTNKILRNSAIVSLIKYCDIAGILMANSTINKLFEDKNDQSTIEILSIINSAGFYGYYELLNSSLTSKSKDVKNEAIKVVGNLKLKRFISYLFEGLKDSAYKVVCLQALYKFKEEIIDELLKEFKTTHSHDIKLSFIKLLSSSKSPKAIEFLFNQISNPIFTYNIIDALYLSNYASKDKIQINNLIDMSIEMILLDSLKQKKINKQQYPKTYKLLKAEQKRKIDMLFSILSFLYPKKTIDEAKINYKSSSKNLQAISLELLDNMLDTSLKQKVIPILESYKNEKKMLYLLDKYNYTTKIEDFNSYLKNKLLDNSMELALILSFIYEIGVNKDKVFYDTVQTIIDTQKDEYIQETAKWCLEQFDKKG